MSDIIARLLISVGVFMASPYLPARPHADAGPVAAVSVGIAPAS